MIGKFMFIIFMLIGIIAGLAAKMYNLAIFFFILLIIAIIYATRKKRELENKK